MPEGVGRRSSVQQIFLVTLARSGSTLLRYLLDAHPEIASPPELNLSALLHHAADTWHRTLDAVLERPPDEPIGPLQAYSPEAYRRARKAVDPIMVRCANLAGASMFCDKSLTTVDHLATVSRCYPRASYIFLYRYPLDMIASGIQASRWGFNAFGFAPYVGATPGNFVAGLANYWIDKVSRMVEFERTCSVAHARIYYELLCDDPAGTMDQLLEFLGLPPDESLIDRVFRSEHGHGPGDYKIDYTGSISAESIGRGSRLPQHLLPGQEERIDELLAELDYPSLETAWRGDLAALIGLKRVTDSKARKEEDDRLVASLMGVLARGWQVLSGDSVPVPRLLVYVGGMSGEDAAIRIDPDRAPALVGSGPPAGEGDEVGRGVAEESRIQIRCHGDVLHRVAAGTVNLAQAVHDGEVRFDREPGGGPNRTRAVMRALGSLLRAGGADGSGPGWTEADRGGSPSAV